MGTYVRNARVGQFAVPLVLDAADLAALVEDIDLAVDGRLLADALDFVESAHVNFDGVSGVGYEVRLALDLGEGRLEAVLKISLALSCIQLERVSLVHVHTH